MIIILMGVSGSGKSTIGSALAADLGWQFYDGDDFMPQANVEKMRNGTPLTDEDRKPWYDILHAKIEASLAHGESAVLACSALKQAYRQNLSAGDERVKFVHLKGDYDLIRGRLEARHDHFMPPGLLGSQFETLEEPISAVVIDVAMEPAEIVKTIKSAIGL